MELKLLTDQEIITAALREYAGGRTWERWTSGFAMLSAKDKEISNANGTRALQLAEEYDPGTSIPNK